MIKIYQIKMADEKKFDDENYRQTLFDIKSGEYKITKEIFEEFYTKVWEGDVGTTDLEEIFEIFNIHHPKDYRGYSLSCGDIVEIPEGKYYCQMFSWEKISI